MIVSLRGVIEYGVNERQSLWAMVIRPFPLPYPGVRLPTALRKCEEKWDGAAYQSSPKV